MMRMRITDNGRIEFFPENDKDRARLAQIPEGSNEVFVFYTSDGGEEGDEEALVIYIGAIPPLEDSEEVKSFKELMEGS